MTRSYLHNLYRPFLAVLYFCLHPFQLCCPEVSWVSVVLLCKFQAPVFWKMPTAATFPLSHTTKSYLWKTLRNMSHQVQTGLHLVQRRCFLSICSLRHYSVNIFQGIHGMVDAFITSYCKMCLWKLFQYVLEVIESCVYCLMICHRTRNNWQKPYYFLAQCFFGNNWIESTSWCYFLVLVFWINIIV